SEQTTPESYLGAEKAERFQGGAVVAGVHNYGSAAPVPAPEHLSYGGTWRVARDSATAVRDATLSMSFRARNVFLVMGSISGRRSPRLKLAGRRLAPAEAGHDIHASSAAVGFQRLYRLVELPRVERHTLSVEPEPGITLYSFTFG